MPAAAVVGRDMRHALKAKVMPAAAIVDTAANNTVRRKLGLAIDAAGNDDRREFEGRVEPCRYCR